MSLLIRHRRRRRGAGSALVPYWYGGRSVGNISNAANLQEISGIDCCRLPENDGLGIVVADSPANVLTIIRFSDATTVGTITLTGAPTGAPSDWEEVASCMIDGVPRWVVGDFGDNGSARASFNMIFFTEIPFTGNHTLACDVVECIFPAGNMPTSKDCESIIFDPIDRDINIITKRDATQKLYSLPYATSYVGQQTFTYEGVVTALPSVTTVPLGATACYAVGATINPAGNEILVKTYNDIYYYPRLAGETVLQALQKSLVIVPAYVGGGSVSPKKSHPNQEPQGEALCYTRNGRNLIHASEYLTGEGSSATAFPLFECTRAPRVPTTDTFQQGVSPTAGYTGCLDTYIWDTNPNTNYGGDATFIVDTALGVESDQRKGLIKFDISSIPTTATVIGVKLELYISTEGQGFKFHKMLVDWNEASTYNSLGGGVDNDGVKAAVAEDARNGINLDGVLGTVVNNMNIVTVQDWVTNPANNFGWMVEQISSATGDGVQFDSSEGATASRRPKLIIYWV